MQCPKWFYKHIQCRILCACPTPSHHPPVLSSLAQVYQILGQTQFQQCHECFPLSCLPYAGSNLLLGKDLLKLDPASMFIWQTNFGSYTRSIQSQFRSQEQGLQICILKILAHHLPHLFFCILKFENTTR